MTEQPPADMTALLRHGPGYAGVLVDELSGWMARKGFRTVGELCGLLSVPAGADEARYERAGYVTALRAANSHAGPW
jgi:dihydroorotate dehydrogenase (fumarate)